MTKKEKRRGKQKKRIEHSLRSVGVENGVLKDTKQKFKKLMRMCMLTQCIQRGGGRSSLLHGIVSCSS